MDDCGDIEKNPRNAFNRFNCNTLNPYMLDRILIQRNMSIPAGI